MAKTDQTTRDRIVEAARTLFHNKGYNATSVADILAAADANSGSLYHFFPNKDALLLAVLDRYVELLMPFVMHPAWQGVSDPIDRVFAVLDRYRTGLIAMNFAKGCPIGNLALEVGDAVPAAREKIALNFNNWSAAIQTCLDAAADRFPPDLDRAALAQFVLTIMEGGTMLARAQHDIAPYDAAVSQLRDYIERLTHKPSYTDPAPRPDEPRPRRTSPQSQPSYRVW